MDVVVSNLYARMQENNTTEESMKQKFFYYGCEYEFEGKLTFVGEVKHEHKGVEQC